MKVSYVLDTDADPGTLSHLMALIPLLIDISFQ